MKYFRKEDYEKIRLSSLAIDYISGITDIFYNETIKEFCNKYDTKAFLFTTTKPHQIKTSREIIT